MHIILISCTIIYYIMSYKSNKIVISVVDMRLVSHLIYKYVSGIGYDPFLILREYENTN